MKMVRMKSKEELSMYCKRIAMELGENYSDSAASMHGVFYTGTGWESSNNVAMSCEHVRVCAGLDGTVSVGMDSNMRYFVDVYTSCDNCVGFDGVGFIADFLMLADAAWGIENYISVRREVELHV